MENEEYNMAEDGFNMVDDEVKIADDERKMAYDNPDMVDDAAKLNTIDSRFKMADKQQFSANVDDNLELADDGLKMADEDRFKMADYKRYEGAGSSSKFNMANNEFKMAPSLAQWGQRALEFLNSVHYRKELVNIRDLDGDRDQGKRSRYGYPKLRNGKYGSKSRVFRWGK